MLRKLGLVLLVGFLLSSLALAQIERSCNMLTTVGTYAVRCSGALVTPAGNVPFEAFGEAVVDYSGYVRAAKTCNNIGGKVSYAPLEGQSIVYPDCTTDVRYYPFGYKHMSMFNKDSWIFYVRANILDGGEVMQGFMLAMQDPDHDFALMPTTPAVQCTLTRKSRLLSPAYYDPNWCTVPAVK